MNRVWITECGMVHYRKPEQEAKEYVLGSDASARITGLLEANNTLLEKNRLLQKEKTDAVLVASKLLETIVIPRVNE